MGAEPRRVQVPFERVAGWLERYDAAHPGTTWRVDRASAEADSPDGTHVEIDVPIPPLEETSLEGLVRHVGRRWLVGVLLVRKGGFAVALLNGTTVVESKTGRRHVQGRTKAGGWSQHRFARRRDNQAQAAFDAAAGHVHRILGEAAPKLDLLGTGGDRQAVANVLAHRDLRPLAAIPQTWLGGVPDPTRDVLDAAAKVARSVRLRITP